MSATFWNKRRREAALRQQAVEKPVEKKAEEKKKPTKKNVKSDK